MSKNTAELLGRFSGQRAAEQLIAAASAGVPRPVLDATVNTERRLNQACEALSGRAGSFQVTVWSAVGLDGPSFKASGTLFYGGNSMGDAMAQLSFSQKGSRLELVVQENVGELGVGDTIARLSLKDASLESLKSALQAVAQAAPIRAFMDESDAMARRIARAGRR